MRAAIIRMEDGKKVLRAEEVENPTVGDRDVLIRVRAAGICGSDSHGFIDSAGTSRREGLIMGHEAAGEVVAVGASVTRTAIGDRVTIDPQVTCGECVSCLHGWISICDNKRVIGSSLRGFEQGTMAELVSIPESQVFVVPSSMSFSDAAMIEPLANALHLVNRAGILIGDSVVIYGAGPLGLCILQAVCLAGVKQVIVSDTAPHRQEMARTLGADVVLSPLVDDVREEVLRLTGGLGADVVIESVGIDATYQDAISVARKRGKVMFFGAVQEMITIPLLPILHKELLLVGCTGANDETQLAIDLVASGRINVGAMVTNQFPLDQAQDAFDLLSSPNDAVKVQVTP